MGNLVKALFLLALPTLLSAFCGYLLGGQKGILFTFIFSCIASSLAFWFGDRIVLSMTRAQPLDESEAPEVFEIVKELSTKAGVPTPRLYMLPSASANAFAAGRDPKHAAIAITHGIVGLLNKEELSGVFGHELSHILNRDILLTSLVAILAGALNLVPSAFRWSFLWGGERDEHDKAHPLAFVLTALFMPVMAILIRFLISRSREYEADKQGAGLCGEPLYLASALRKIEIASKRIPLRDAGPATAHLFIMSPLSGKGWPVFFNTHPPVEKRIERLMTLSGKKEVPCFEALTMEEAAVKIRPS